MAGLLSRPITTALTLWRTVRTAMGAPDLSQWYAARTEWPAFCRTPALWGTLRIAGTRPGRLWCPASSSRPAVRYVAVRATDQLHERELSSSPADPLTEHDCHPRGRTLSWKSERAIGLLAGMLHLCATVGILSCGHEACGYAVERARAVSLARLLLWGDCHAQGVLLRPARLELARTRTVATHAVSGGAGAVIGAAALEHALGRPRHGAGAQRHADGVVRRLGSVRLNAHPPAAGADSSASLAHAALAPRASRQRRERGGEGEPTSSRRKAWRDPCGRRGG
eukprot:scaffold2119_cov355-Prasinococcus_capsulatus_cf.AAC.15